MIWKKDTQDTGIRKEKRAMAELDTEGLREELRHFREEKDKIRAIVGQIGGRQARQRDRVITIVFTVLILVLLAFDLCRHMLGLNMDWLPQLFSLELGILLVSIKIIWMIHKQAKIDHFQFWILNSIEFRLNDMSKRMREIEVYTKLETQT